jgi:hypothetical protein
MNYFDVYKKRIQLSGSNATEASKNATIDSINRTFSEMLNYQIVKINDVDTEVIIINKDDSTQKELLLRPNQTVKKGAKVLIDTQYYLVTDFNGNGINQKAKIKLCNNTLTLKGTTTEIIVGYNDFNEPITETISSEDIVIPCIVETTITFDDTEQAINLPEGKIRVTIPYTEHEDIAIDKEFIMYGEKYKIIGIDYTQSINKEGLIIINGKKVS